MDLSIEKKIREQYIFLIKFFDFFFQERTKKSGHKLTTLCVETFSFDGIGAKEKVTKRKRRKVVSTSAEVAQGSAFGNRKPLKRHDLNFEIGVCA